MAEDNVDLLAVQCSHSVTDDCSVLGVVCSRIVSWRVKEFRHPCARNGLRHKMAYRIKFRAEMMLMRMGRPEEVVVVGWKSVEGGEGARAGFSWENKFPYL